MPLNLTEARSRAALITNVATTVELDLTDETRFGCRARIDFDVTDPAANTFAELTDPQDLVVVLNGVTLDPSAVHDGERIALTGLAEHNTLEVSARLRYVRDGDGMHTVIDPTDGERYVSAYTAMDVARKVLPCFDQPDIKTTFSVSVLAPAHWTVLANGALLGREQLTATPDGALDTPADTARWTFTTTPAISSYLFTLGGGPWASFSWDVEHLGRTIPFGWHARKSLAAELERDAAELREITEACFRHYTTIFTEPYPFEDYQQLFGPGLNWGAMEFPGCVVFRDELLFRGTATAMDSQRRAMVIAHEMAHMWFGDLVTMHWWQDTWLNESFADYMGYQVAGVAADLPGTWTGFALERKPTAYRADRRRSTHPVAPQAESLPDVATAFGNFDMITYAKGNAVLRQLVTWLGEQDFLAGVNRHLSAHAFGNADLADFLDALDAASDRDVRSWAQKWLRSTGFDTVTVTRDGDVPVLLRQGSRPHRFTVAAFDDSLTEVGSVLVDLDDDPLPLPQFAGRVVVPNALDESYIALALDERSWGAVRRGLGTIERPVTRALLWSTAVWATEDGALSPADLVELARDQLAGELDPLIFEGATNAVLRVLRRYAHPDRIEATLGELAALARATLLAGDVARRQPAARLLAATDVDTAAALAWLNGSTDLPEPDQDVRWLLVTRLVELGAAGVELIERESRRDPSDSGVQAALRARAAQPDAAAKAASWKSLMSGELSNRDFVAIASGFWGWRQHDLVAPYLAAYTTDALALGRRSGQMFEALIGQAFPWLPLTDPERSALRASLAGTLAGADDIPTVLRRSWDDVLDDLDRVIAARP